MGPRYIILDIGAERCRLYRQKEYVDSALGAVLDCWARRVHGRGSAVYSYRRDSTGTDGASYSVTVVELPAVQAAPPVYNVLAQKTLWIDREDLLRARQWLGGTTPTQASGRS